MENEKVKTRSNSPKEIADVETDLMSSKSLQGPEQFWKSNCPGKTDSLYFVNNCLVTLHPDRILIIKLMPFLNSIG